MSDGTGNKVALYILIINIHDCYADYRRVRCNSVLTCVHNCDKGNQHPSRQGTVGPSNISSVNKAHHAGEPSQPMTSNSLTTWTTSTVAMLIPKSYEMFGITPHPDHEQLKPLDTSKYRTRWPNVCLATLNDIEQSLRRIEQFRRRAQAKLQDVSTSYRVDVFIRSC